MPEMNIHQIIRKICYILHKVCKRLLMSVFEHVQQRNQTKQTLMFAEDTEISHQILT